MSLQHIVDAANQLAHEGKKPSVALIKSRVTQPASLRDIIETLKTWHFDPSSVVEKNHKPATTSTEVADPTADLITEAMTSLRAELTPLYQEVSELKAEIAALKKALLNQ